MFFTSISSQAMISFMFVEAARVRWYPKAGLWRGSRPPCSSPVSHGNARQSSTSTNSSSSPIRTPAGGRETAHQIINNSNAELRYISVGTMLRPKIVEYPYSNKFSASAIQPGSSAGFRHLGVLAPAVDYWHGES
jgi:hypothetical protein